MLFILFLIFLVLKLAGLVDWSWWAVCTPLGLEVLIAIFRSWAKVD
jgi:hypothetical protein